MPRSWRLTPLIASCSMHAMLCSMPPVQSAPFKALRSGHTCFLAQTGVDPDGTGQKRPAQVNRSALRRAFFGQDDVGVARRVAFSARHIGRVDGRTSPATILGRIQGDVGVIQHLVGTRVVILGR